MKLLFRKAFIRLRSFVPSFMLKFFSLLRCIFCCSSIHLSSVFKGKASFSYIICQIGKQRHKVIKLIHLVLYCNSAAKSGAKLGTHGCQSIVSSNSALCHVQCYSLQFSPATFKIEVFFLCGVFVCFFFFYFHFAHGAPESINLYHKSLHYFRITMNNMKFNSRYP